jgi:hypothetical protein
MGRSLLLYAVIKYQPTEKRNPGSPLKRLTDCYTEMGTSHGA